MISGDLLQKILLAEYFFIAAIYLIEKDYNRTLYWIAAAFLTLAVIRMK